MRIQKTRAADSNFDLNLAPMLDIIVSIVPMLLMGIAFLEIKMLETPVPQVVAEAMQKENELKELPVNLSLRLARSGFVFEVDNKGQKSQVEVKAKDSKLDFVELKEASYKLKQQFPNTYKIALLPDQNVSYFEIVQAMDAVRKSNPTSPKFQIVDAKTGAQSETDLMFPNASFGNVLGEN